MSTTTIIIADDHTLIRETWSYIINNEPSLSVTGEAASGEEAIELAKELAPDIVIMDINLPGINGIEATEQILKLCPGTKVLGISLHTQPNYARKMMHNGASGYVTKSSPREEMFKAIEEISAGRKYICRQIKEILSEQLINGEDPDQGLHLLSSREMEVIRLIKDGLSSKEIAEALSISSKTVELHRYNILHKLQLKNTAALINFINQSSLTLNE